MPNRTKQQLLDKASQLREMAGNGDDLELRKALLQVAEEFEQEAMKLSDVDQAIDGTPGVERALRTRWGVATP